MVLDGSEGLEEIDKFLADKVCNIYRTRKRSLPRYQNAEKCVEKRGRRPSFLTTSRCFETVVKTISSSLYSFSNESVFKEKIEVKVVLIYGSSLPRYQDTIIRCFSE